MTIPRTFVHNGVLFDRVTIDFAGGRSASQVRAHVHDALIRTHGFQTARNLTDALAKRGGRFRVAIARTAIKALKRRLSLLVDIGQIDLYVAGRRVHAVR